MQHLPKQEASTRAAAMRIATEVLQTVRAKGFFGQTEDGKLFLYDADASEVIYIENGTRPHPLFKKWLFDQHAYIVDGSRAEKQAYEIITCSARAEAPLTVHRFAHYDHDQQALYLNRYDGTLYRLDGKRFDTIPNGRESFFLNDDGGRPFDSDVQPSIANHGILQEKLVDDLHYADTETITAAAQKALFTTWIFALPFLNLLPGPPILLLEGAKGSGKTTTVKRVQKLLFDRITNQPLGKREDDFPIMLLRSPVCLLDNVDNYVSWLPDQIAAYATGACWIRRQLYSDQDQVRIQPQSWITVTSRNPSSFKRDDVLDRAILLRLARREGAFASERELMADLSAYRPELYGEWLWYINRIIAEYKKNGLPTIRTQRMSDYAALCTLIAKVVGIDPKLIASAFVALDDERKVLQSEDDVLTELLLQVANTSLGEALTARAIYAKLDTLTMCDGFTLAAISKSPKALGLQLKSRIDLLGEYYDVTVTTGAARKRFYTFREKDKA